MYNNNTTKFKMAAKKKNLRQNKNETLPRKFKDSIFCGAFGSEIQAPGTTKGSNHCSSLKSEKSPHTRI